MQQRVMNQAAVYGLIHTLHLLLRKALRKLDFDVEVIQPGWCFRLVGCDPYSAAFLRKFVAL